MFARLTLAVTLAFASVPAIADTISLTKEMQAKSLHVGGIDMVVYFTETLDAFEVVATSVSQSVPKHASRIRMGLVSGDAISFSMPGKAHVSYRFARIGDLIEVEADFVGQTIARLNR